MDDDTFNRLADFDRKENRDFTRCIAGVDEAGRGPLAGPVVAAAVMFSPQFLHSNLEKLNDSKKLSSETRFQLFKKIAGSSRVGLGIATEGEIDHWNIYQATRMAMKRAVLSLSRTPDLILIDGNMKLDLPLPQKSIIKGDGKSASIAAASVIAKVFRDTWMVYLDSLYPIYRFKQHKGYGTKDHIKRIRSSGPSPVHRKTFSPVYEMLNANSDIKNEN